MQVFRRLRAEHDFSGGYDQVRRYVARQRRNHRETFIPLAHEPGQRLEADFGHVQVDFPDGRRAVSVLITAWSYSNYPFALALPTERTEAILAGMVEAFAFFGCVPREVWWDNPTTVVHEILVGRERRPHPLYAALASHYTFEPLFGMPARGNEKPYAQTRVRVLQRQWSTPVPKVDDLAAFNALLRQRCLQEAERTVAGYAEPIGVRFGQDRSAALALPDYPFDACIRQPAEVDKYQTVRFDNNRYRVPRWCAYQGVTGKGYVDRVEVVARDQVVASHARSYGHNEQILDPLHYLAALERRPAALDHAPVLRDWQLPEAFTRLREALEKVHGSRTGVRHFVRVLQLLAEHPLGRVQQAVEKCLGHKVLTAERLKAQAERLGQSSEKEPGVTTPCHSVEEAQKQYQLDRVLGQLDRADLLICDELGYLSFSRAGAELLFQVFADRYERKSLLVTSNLAFGDWGGRCFRASG